MWAQLRNPLLLILVFAACASASTGEWIDATIVLAIVVASVGMLGLPFLPHAELLDFVPLSGSLLLTICGITAAYVMAAEGVKAWFYRAVAAPP